MLEKHQKKFFFAMVWVFVLFTGCATQSPVCTKQGGSFCNSEGIFTHQWYDYYERALSCIEGGCYQQASDNIDKAVSARPDDKRMAKTYGMHFTDYFPHREKGIVYYLTGQHDAAKKELELSVSYEKSAKALFYLDKVRKYFLEQEAAFISVPKLIINNLSDSDELWTKNTPVNISGIAEDTQYISEITIGNKPVFFEGSQRQIVFEEPLTSDEGVHQVVVIAKNLLNGEIRKNITIHVDRTGPVIVIKDIQPDTEIRGYVYDDSENISLKVNGSEYPLSKGREAEFVIPLAPNLADIRLIATDRLGNETSAVINIPSILSQYKTMLFAQNTGIIADSQANILKSRQSAPVIILKDSPDGKTVFDETISLKGQIQSQNEIESVLINHHPLYEKHGKVIFFNHPISLSHGSNHIVIHVKNSREQESIQNLTVIREIPEPMKLKYRCMFVTEPFTMYSPNTEHDTQAEAFQQLLLNGLIARNRFQIRFLKDYETKSSSVRFMLSGYFHRFEKGLEAVAKVVDISTSEMIAVLDAYTENKDSGEAAARLTEKFHKTFPLVKGKITRKHGEKMLVNADGDIRMKWTLVVGSDTRLSGHACIDEKMSGGNYSITLTDGGNPVIGDWVITQ